MTGPFLVTGANGFVGNVLCEELARRGVPVTAAVRSAQALRAASCPTRTVEVGTIDGNTDWSAALAGCDVVIHAAARAHVLNDQASDPLAAFRQTNVEGTMQLARSAMQARVRRFVFVSSVGVHGNLNTHAFSEADTPHPAEAYAVSKLEAEVALRALVAGSPMELVVVRPPLVYGPECPGNFLRLLKLLSSGLPLPFGAIGAKRSFVSIWNLVDFLIACAVHERAAGQVFLVSDQEDVTLPGLLRGLAEGTGAEARLFAFSPRLLGMLAAAAGKRAMFEKLCGGLTVDATLAQRMLGWQPPVALAEGLRRTGAWYAARR